MKVVVPYATLSPGVLEALREGGSVPEPVYVGDTPTSYHGLVERLWQHGETFLLVEQDVIVRADTAGVLEACPDGWCGFAYSIGSHYGAYLGCTRFRAEFLADHAGAFAAIAQLRDDGTPRRYWGRLDTRLKQVLETQGAVMHVHWPALEHLNLDKPEPIYNCASCGRAIPGEVARSGPPPYPCDH